MQSRQLLITAAIFTDVYIALVVYQEWHSPCEFPIHALMLAFIFCGLPATMMVESVRVKYSFRTAFLVELLAGCCCLVLLFVGTRLVLQHYNGSCTITAPRLWKLSLLSMCLSWTCIILGAIGLILITLVVMLAPESKQNRASPTPVLRHKFRAYYGTL